MKRIEVAAAIIIRDGRIFATQRGYGNYRHKWEFPGGKLESGETGEQAIVREIREELEADISVGELFYTVDHDYPEFHVTMYCYLCTLKSDHLTLVEHEAAKWLGRDDIDSVDWLPSDLEVVDKLKKYVL
ncbi:MAG: 8-oxo-dGTP diphosphatase MutT [Mogibacterium sp.]|nr:8-oxo-dGTP diphosphatase MutT [Mogibacterium sp.]